MAKKLPTTLALLVCLITAGFGYDALLTDDTSLALTGRITNNGRAATLGINSKRHALFKFGLAELPPDKTADGVLKATLTVFISNVVKPGSLGLYRVQGEWSEDQIPAVTFAPLSGQLAVVSKSAKKAFLRFDITDVVKSWIAGTAANEGLSISALTADDSISLTFDSKENSATGHCARLSIEFSAHASFVQSVKGVWASSVEYQAGDIVTVLGSTYVAATANTNSNPAIDLNAWSLLAGKGDKGEPGEKGDTGDKGDKGDPGSSGIRSYAVNASPTDVLAPVSSFTMAGTLRFGYQSPRARER
jgi:hypothetical protein